LSSQQVLQRYQKRWRVEVDYWRVKQQRGLGDYRLQSFEAVARWYSVVYLVLTYLYWASMIMSVTMVLPSACQK